MTSVAGGILLSASSSLTSHTVSVMGESSDSVALAAALAKDTVLVGGDCWGVKIGGGVTSPGVFEGSVVSVCFGVLG